MFWSFRYLAAIGCLSFVAPAEAVPAFLKISRNGNPVATDPSHSWVSVLGYSQELGGEDESSNQNVGKLRLEQDRSLSELMNFLLLGQAVDLKLQVPRQSSVMLEVEFRAAKFHSISANVQPGDDSLTFDLEFHYEQMLWTITTVNPRSGEVSGVIGTGFDAVNQLLIERGAVTVPAIGDYASGGTDPSFSDLDGDGMPDSWESENGLDANDASDAAGDPDKDGFTNLEEYLTGTVPRAGDSFFKASILSTEGGEAVTLSWSSVVGRTYTVLFTDDLANEFVPLTTIQASGEITSHVVNQQTRGFFKVLSK